MVRESANDAGRRSFGLVARRMLGALVAGATLGVAVLASAPAPASASGCVSAAGMESTSEARFVTRLNDMRRSKGLGALATNTAIASQARSWSGVMGSQDWLHHARDTGAGDGVEPHQDYVTLISQVLPDWRRAAENVGTSGMRTWCTADELRNAVLATSDSLHDAFVRSSGHYANMVGDFNQVGIGVAFVNGKMWVTVRFAKGTLPAPAPSLAQISLANEYVGAVYELFLDRSASLTDLNHWAPIVAVGDRTRLTNALAVSNEWAGSRVAELYRTVLHREADAGGRAAWVRAIAGGMRLEDVAAGFYGSQERFNAEGGSVTEYVKGLYEDILNRPADAGGLRDWVAKIEGRRMSRTQVAAGFYGSVESRTTRVKALYAEILNRAPDAGGLSHWVRQLASMGDVVLASTLASSPEYWQRATS
jgi:uncharacterized protein YkwD